MRAWLDELADWWDALPPEWMFLMLLPLAVAVAGLLAWWSERQETRAPEALPRRHRGSH